MALKFKFKSKDEVPAEHLSLYAERDGAWCLDVDGAVEKSKLDEFRTNNIALAKEREQGRVIVVANRVTSAEDVERIAAGLPGIEMTVVPDDPAIMDADRRGLSPLDTAPESPAVVALVALARFLLD